MDDGRTGAQFDSAALIVIDAQEGFVNTRSEHVIPVLASVIERWQSLGRPVVFTRFVNKPGSLYEELINWRRLQGPPETELHPDLKPLATSIIDKHGYTFFTSEGADLVARNRWPALVFCGIATESCVLKSAVDAFERGVIPWVLRDASASPAGEPAHDAGLHVLGRFIGGGQLINSEELFAESPSSSAEDLDATSSVP